MKEASTALTAKTVTPNTRPNILVHTISYTRLQNPERKNRKSRKEDLAFVVIITVKYNFYGEVNG